MIDPTKVTTELDAVNIMLSVTTGAVNITDLNEAAENSDVEAALFLLRTTTRALMTKGWQWNTDVDVTLYRGLDGTVTLPPGVVKVTPAPGQDLSFAIRGSRLYNRRTRSYTWDVDPICTTVTLLPFEEMPEPARQYVTIAAARQFQARTVGSETLHGFTQIDEAAALVTLQEWEAEAGNYNILTGSQSVAGAWSIR